MTKGMFKQKRRFFHSLDQLATVFLMTNKLELGYLVTNDHK